VYLWRLFITSPILAIALCACLAGIMWCIAILRKQKKGPDRFLAALIGAICVTEGLRLLQHTGLISMGTPLGLDSFAELMITALYLISIIILRVAAMEHKSAEVRLRLVEANDRPRIAPIINLEHPEQSVSDIILDSNPLATIALDKAGKVIYWNFAAERLLGWKSDEVMGHPSPLSFTSPVGVKSGVQLRVESWVSAIHDSAGRPCGTVHMLAPLLEPTSPEPKSIPCDAPALA
jgi:PAS domain-containing protein